MSSSVDKIIDYRKFLTYEVVAGKKEVQLLTNEEYFEKIVSPIEELRILNEEAKTLAVKIIGKNLLKEDLCLCAMLDRSMHLTDGFIPMMEARNLTCAGALLRLQMDNCLRLFALFIAKDRNEAVDRIIDGGVFSRLKDKDGKQMRDGYLKEKLDRYDPCFADVYSQASGFIHFSSKAFYQSVHPKENHEISFRVGGKRPEKINPVLLECVDAYIHYIKLFHRLMNIIAESKTEFDTNYERCNCGSFNCLI